MKILIDAIDDSDNTGVAYFAWIDADMIVLDMGLKLEEIGAQYPDAHILMSKDVIHDSGGETGAIPDGSANSGFILVRNTPRARQILLHWWSEYPRHEMSDQSAFLLMYNAMTTMERENVGILRPDALNSIFPAWLNQKPGNQFLHLAGKIDGRHYMPDCLIMLYFLCTKS